MLDGGALIVFARTPVQGQTKTRLIPVLGPGGAAKLHAELLYHTLLEARRSFFSSLQLWCLPSIDHPVFAAYAKKFAANLYLQTGEDLGIRMHNALEHALKHYTFAVIVGSDCPVLSTNILNQAHAALDGGYDAVLGPCEDGGYYLIGARQADHAIFHHTDWGKTFVAERTRQNFRMLGWSWLETDELWDVDNMEDLLRYESGRDSTAISE